jgi:hypothetical protein
VGPRGAGPDSRMLQAQQQPAEALPGIEERLAPPAPQTGSWWGPWRRGSGRLSPASPAQPASPPPTRADHRKITRQRGSDAECLVANGRYESAVYLGE